MPQCGGKACVTLRAVFRLGRVALHLAGGLCMVTLVYPCITPGQRLALKQRWSRHLLNALGVALKVPAGTHRAGVDEATALQGGRAKNTLMKPLRSRTVEQNTLSSSLRILAVADGDMVTQTVLPAGMLVANHISFLDIFVINAWAPAAFVAKDEVKKWPLVGWLSQRTDTIFLQRGSRQAAHAAHLHLVEKLRAGTRVAIFPEGTTSDGHTVQPFHSALLQSAIDAAVPLLPLALRYLDAQTHQPSHAADYVGEMSLLECLWSIASSQNLVAQLAPLPAITSAGADRRHLAAYAHRVVAHHLLHALNPNPSASPAAHTADETPAGLPVVPQ